jgi:hypothetical protein
MTKSFNCPLATKSVCEQIKAVDWKDVWHAGGTGYIDGIKPSDEVFNEASVVKFVDPWQRSAIAFKYSVACPNKALEEYAVAAFERYTGDGDFWVYGGHHAHSWYSHGQFANEIQPNGYLVDKDWLEQFLMNGKGVSHQQEHVDETDSVELTDCLVNLAEVSHLSTEL